MKLRIKSNDSDQTFILLPFSATSLLRLLSLCSLGVVRLRFRDFPESEHCAT